MERQPSSLPLNLATLDGAEEPEENWILSYLDVFALIATLFIVLTVIAQLKLAQQQQTQQQQAAQLAAARQALHDTRAQLDTIGSTGVLSETALTTLLQQSEWQRDIQVTQHAEFTELQIGERLLFDSADASLLPAGRALLNQLLPVLKESNARIQVEGHTDNQPINTLRFTSNWELAAARATNVVQFFADHGIPAARLRAISAADTAPIASNATEAGRAQNRRVSLQLRQAEPETITQPADLTVAMPTETTMQLADVAPR